MAINSVSLIGNLTRDPELTMTPGGTIVLRFSIAVNEKQRPKEMGGEWVDYTNYFDAVMFGTRAEAVSRYLKKGNKVGISGRLHQDRWETADGQKRNKVQVRVDEIEFMSLPPKRNGDEPPAQHPGGSDPSLDQSIPKYTVPHAPAPDIADEDIPF